MPKIGTKTLVQLGIQQDDTDKIAASLYAKATAAGDTPLQVVSAAQPLLKVSAYSAAGAAQFVTSSLIDGLGASGVLLGAAYQMLFSGTNWDRGRGVYGATVAASAARTAELVTADQTNYNHRGFILSVNVTARAGATTLTPKLELKDPVSGEYLLIWTAAAAINSADLLTMYLFYPTTVPTALKFTEHLPIPPGRTFRFTITPNNADSVTYSVGIDYLL